jgi:hypothetical protein
MGEGERKGGSVGMRNMKHGRVMEMIRDESR